jgi:hypothetical protein
MNAPQADGIPAGATVKYFVHFLLNKLAARLYFIPWL